MHGRPVFKKLALWGLFASFLLAAPNLAPAATYTGGDDGGSPGLSLTAGHEFTTSNTGNGGNSATQQGAAGIITSGDLTSRSSIFGKGGRGSDTGWLPGGSGVQVAGNLYNYNVLQGTGGEPGLQGPGGTGIHVAGDYFAYKGGLLNATTALAGVNSQGLLVDGNVSMGKGTHLVVGGGSAPGLYVGGDLSLEKGSRLIMQNEWSGIQVMGAVSMENISVYLLDTLIVEKGNTAQLNNFLNGFMINRGDLPEDLDGPVLEVEFDAPGSSFAGMSVTAKEDLTFFLSSRQGALVNVLRDHYRQKYVEFPLELSAEHLVWYIPVLDSMNQPTVAGVQGTFDRFYKSLGSENTANTFKGISLGHSQAATIITSMGKSAATDFERTNSFKYGDTALPLRHEISLSDPQSLNTASGGTDGGLPMLVWAQPFAHFGKLDLKGGGSMDQDFYGVSAGFALATEIVTVSLGGHYIRSDFDASGYDANADTYGLNLSLGRRFLVNEWFNPWLDVHFGYSRVELDQDRRDYYGDKASSKPDADVFSVGLSMDNLMLLTEEFALIPKLGLDYTTIDMDSYTESGSGLAMRVSPDDYESLRGELGLAARWLPREDFNLEARASWYLEMMDTKAELRSHGANMPGVQLVSKGQEQGRSSLGLGAGLNWQPTDNIGLGLNYDFLLEEKYQGHQVNASFKFTF